MKIDDSAIFHGVYDPVKAHEYYLRTRKLKGRKKGSGTTPSTKPEGRPEVTTSPVRTGKPNRADTKSRQEELKAQRDALLKRLEHLKSVLRKAVAAAKKRSGGDPNKKDTKDTAPETKADKADRNADAKSKKPLTASQKRKKAAAAREEYEKEHPTSLSTEIESLQRQIKEIQAKIEKAVADARERNQRKTAGTQGEKSPATTRSKPNDGPRGR